MKIKVEFTPTEAYYKELYGQWLQRSKWKKWEPLLAIIFLLLGIGLYFLNTNPDLWFLPLVLIGLSLYELFIPDTAKLSAFALQLISVGIYFKS